MVRKHCIVGAESLFAQQSQHANSAVPGESAVAPDSHVAPVAPAARLLPDDPQADALSLIREAGLVGMGGAGFLTWKKLEYGKGASVVIANAAECEPLLAHNIARLETDAERIVSGLIIAMRIVGASKGIVAIKAKNVAAVASLQTAVQSATHSALEAAQGSLDLSVFFLQDRYPAGDERAIVRDVLGTLIAPTSIPGEAGAVVINVETLLRVHEAVVDRKPVTTKDITVAGLIDGSGYERDTSIVLYDVPIGISLREVLAALNIAEPGPDAQLLTGGPYMGNAAQLDDTITATCGGIMIAGPEIPDPGPVGIIVCACGASEERLKSIVAAEGASLAGIELCKNAVRLPNGRLKCANPGICPGQAQAVLALKKQGATGLLIGHCTDCSNTVMQIAPKLGLRVHHATDAYLRAGDERLVRSFRKTQPATAHG
ncbi:proline reductase-associated electron transfer protein PrdC [Bifidobacterium tibiigranuli]|jgi:proline reductase-associated electron transfer protein PrdC|uniref:Proline reductase-associated electron transfer protein PrdC n=1 Tax=Bifidobacterium tibiigranuli TaxID=2172043 RepID=A0A5N6RYC6_9BIFI|nr:proline reductase-associated electron transfer protein PrdC [Bifidobacterium tibiigranuli]KAE8126793.1 proline reductase-associated electron transfer protein PrdC [Bifidobacterium tibiigranuli]KAE8126877.1 proline reductase-associated electron transfer protein PrdC [Bifidobacterium tibiigranuli]MCI1673107.1 proline reductase-associated electron transfer protein PrdC [Bifidobacterium tibiigranuli]MCI1713207.1 proline reductase-associated electron transfer protein PrdC [Bifidobacterium tibiigr